MRKMVTLPLLLATLIFVFGCGDNGFANLNGAWNGATTSTQGGENLAFTFNMQEGTASGNTIPVTFSSLAFTTQNVCFDNTAEVTGTITVPGSGNRTMVVDAFSGAGQTGNHAVLTMTIAADNSSVTGTYTLTGGTNGCLDDAGNATFTRQ